MVAAIISDNLYIHTEYTYYWLYTFGAKVCTILK